MSVLTVNHDNFDELVIRADKPVLLDFWASWCGPCRMLSPVVEEISNEHPEIAVGKVNVDIETELAEKFKIVSIPALFVIRNGRVVNQAVGAIPKEQILDLLQ